MWCISHVHAVHVAGAFSVERGTRAQHKHIQRMLLCTMINDRVKVQDEIRQAFLHFLRSADSHEKVKTAKFDLKCELHMENGTSVTFMSMLG